MSWSRRPHIGGGAVRAVVPDRAPMCHLDDTEHPTGPRSWLWTAAPSDLLPAPGLHSRRPKALRPVGRTADGALPGPVDCVAIADCAAISTGAGQDTPAT